MSLSFCMCMLVFAAAVMTLRIPLQALERKVYSQNGEDGIIEALMHVAAPLRGYVAEIGCEDARECNTRYIREKLAIPGLYLDGRFENAAINLHRAFVTAENINQLLETHRVPKDLDLLSIDIDGNDLWVWKAISPAYRPKIVVIEYNATYPPPMVVAQVYDPNHVWDLTNCFGASLQAFVDLAKTKGYELVHCDARGVNAFFLRSDLADRFHQTFERRGVAAVYRPAMYGAHEHVIGGVRSFGHRRPDRPCQTVSDVTR